METNEPTDPVEPSCVRCGTRNILDSSRTPLCSDCREWYIKFPIPLWLKFFAGGIGIILLFAVSNITRSISPGIHLNRGIRAENEKKFLTARNEFLDASSEAPEYVKAQAHLMIASFYNQDLELFSSTYGDLEGKNIDDSELLEHLNNVISTSETYFPSNKFAELMNNYKEYNYYIPTDSLKVFIEKNDSDLYGLVSYAGNLFKDQNYPLCDSILEIILKFDPKYIPALCMESTLKRETGKFNESIECCEKVLNINVESLYALSSKARTFLKMKRDKEALELSLKTRKLDSKDGYTLATLILAQHFNNNIKERDELLSEARQIKDSETIESVQFAKDVISKKEFFRN